MKVVIVGGVAGGATAAARLRRLDEQAQIVIIERTGYVSYANCGLPYYIGGVITEKNRLTLQTPQSFKRRFNIDVRVSQEVLHVDVEGHRVLVRRLEDGSEYYESYDKLILSPGATPSRPATPGADSKRILTLRTVDDTFRMRELVEREKPRTAVIVGGGFIGIEVAENLLECGINTVLLQRSAHVMPPLDLDMACLVHAYMREKGLDLRLNTPVQRYEQRDDGGVYAMRVVLEDGSAIDADMVFMGTGVTPDTQLAKDAGLQMGVKGSIVVDQQMHTSAPDIYAVGDAIQVVNNVSGAPANIPLAGPANKQGRIAANDICGIQDAYRGSQGSSILKFFDLVVASTGLNEKTAKAAGIQFDNVVLRPASHATYFPGASPITVKVLFEPTTGKILGGQMVGFSGVDKRIDVLATAIRFGATAADLEELDLAYAPPFSSAKDPVNMAGYIIGNVVAGRFKQFYWSDVDALPRDGSVQLLDVRMPWEYNEGHLEGFVNIELDELRNHIDQLDPAKPVYIHCKTGMRSYIACRLLGAQGFDCYNLAGGYSFYQDVMAGIH